MKPNKKAKIYFIYKNFLNALPYHILVIGSVFFISFILGKYFEAICYLISFFSLRYKFPKTYHADNIFVCMSLTISIFTISVFIVPPISMYLFANILFAYVECLLLYIIQDRIELSKCVKKLDIKILELEDLLKSKIKKDIYSMNENELYEHCRFCGLNENDCKIAYFVVIERLKGKELYNAINYSEIHTKRKRKQILDKIK